MKAFLRKFLIATVLIVCAIAAANIPVTTRQGVDYEVRAYHIPLYIKVIEFIDRDYQYRRLVREITAGVPCGEAQVLAIFNWCVANIRHKPDGFPIVDDHPLNIIVRGYGVKDQFEDVFTILCTYAGFEAFYKEIVQPSGERYLIAFVKIGGKWYPFSVNRAIAPEKGGKPVSIGDIAAEPASAAAFIGTFPGFEPRAFVVEAEKAIGEERSTRVRGQSPMGRLLCVLRGSK